MIKYFKIFIIALLPIGVNAQVTFNSTLMDSVDISTYVQLTNNENHKSLFYSKYALSLILQRGDLILGQGNFAKAEEYYRQAALLSSQISDSVLTKRLPFGESIYESEIHLGNLYLATNNMRKAEFYFNSALEIKQKNLPKRSVFIVNAYIGLGNVHIKKGQVDKALFYFTEGEDLLTEHFPRTTTIIH